MNRMHTPDTAERRGALRATALPARSGRRDRNGRSKPGVDLSHQTLAAARNPKGFGGDWRVRSSCPSEWGSTTEPLRGSGAEGGHVQGSDSVLMHVESGQEANHAQLTYPLKRLHWKVMEQTDFFSHGKTAGHRDFVAARRGSETLRNAEEGDRQKRRRRCCPSPVPRRGTDLPGCSCVRSRREGWKKGLPANR